MRKSLISFSALATSALMAAAERTDGEWKELLVRRADVQRMAPHPDPEIAAWNAAVDARKAAKRASK